MSETVHLLPRDDKRPHIESGEWCHCQPRVDREGSATLVSHNAYDGREFYEEDKDWQQSAETS